VSLAALEEHRERCRTCRPWSLCADGAALLQETANEAAKRIAPAPVEVIDLPGHVASCVNCRGQRLCHVGRRIADRQADAWIEAGAENWRFR
jgi:hypothetical protein